MEKNIASTLQLQMTGGCPNVYFNSNAGTLLDVKNPRFMPLPTADNVSLTDRASYRYIQEDDELWRRLHKGRLTTSKLNAALGLYEPHAAKLLGLPRGYISHNKIVSVYHHLRENVVHVEGVERGGDNIQAHLGAYEQHLKKDASFQESVKVKKSRYLNTQRDIQKVRMAWGSAQEAATVSLLCSCLSGVPFFLLEVGLMVPEPQYLVEKWKFGVHELPPIGATPDGLLLEDCTDACVAATAFANDHGRFRILEIKNVCPFSARRNGKKGFELRDRGPRNMLDPLYVPQLQFHLLCSRMESAFLVSRSATKGTNVFEMKRDDDYIRSMLEIIRCFYVTYVKKDRIPPQNAFSHMRLHKQLLLKTRELAYSCPLYCHIDQTYFEGTDMRSFLDSVDTTLHP